jgi:hypothetical protein
VSHFESRASRVEKRTPRPGKGPRSFEVLGAGEMDLSVFIHWDRACVLPCHAKGTHQGPPVRP